MKQVRFAASSLALAAFLLSTPAAAQQAPEIPSIWREVTGIRPDSQGEPAFTRPHIPGFRTTSDGRIGINVESKAALFSFFTLNPEKLSGPLLVETNHSDTIVSTSEWAITEDLALDPGNIWSTVHSCLWDTGEWPKPHPTSPSWDRYELFVLTSAKDSNQHSISQIRFYRTKFEVVVRFPKTANARIIMVNKLGSTVEGPILNGPTSATTSAPFHGTAFEPTVSANGQLMVVRFASPDMTWDLPGPVPPHYDSQVVDIAYSYTTNSNPEADPNEWTDFLPISLAPYDTRINGSLGFALAPFRDPTGAPVIADPSIQPIQSYDLGGTYPWIDRKGDNLFFEAIDDRLDPFGNLAVVTGLGGARYANSLMNAGDFTGMSLGAEDAGNHQGVSFVGKWSHGKIVQLDNLNNDMDYAVSPGGTSLPKAQHRLVELYEIPTGAPWWIAPVAASLSDPAQGKLHLAYGRETTHMPPFENDNANIIDSLENKLNYMTNATPVAFRDVVWHMNNSKQTDQLVFDDYLDPDAFILSSMVGVLERESAPLVGGAGSSQTFAEARFDHKSGWSSQPIGFTHTDVQLQNAATPLADRWAVPTHGQVIGSSGRLEPVASGGVHGKGFWLTGSNGLSYSLPTQPVSQAFALNDWYVGLFLDSRPAGANTDLQVMSFPDGTELRLVDRRQFLFVDTNGATDRIVHRVTVPEVLATAGVMADLVPEKGWCHIGLQIRNQGTLVDFHLNGLLLSRWTSNGNSVFQLVEGGDLVVGASAGGSDGFRGWIDDFKVLAHTVDTESACNHAGGTLIGLDSPYAGAWRSDFADRYPDWVHESINAELVAEGEAPHEAFACFYDYKVDYGANRESLELLTGGPSVNTGVEALREAIVFPEGPLFDNLPRPDTQTNSFCISCHHAGAETGLDLQALAYTGVPVPDDPRRQPFAAPPLLFGNIPQDLVGPGEPATALQTSTGKKVDELTFDTHVGAMNVESITLYDPATGESLMDLPVSTTGPLSSAPALDPAILGTVNLAIRANLDHGQGTVNFTFNGAGPFPLPKHPYQIPLVLQYLDFVNPNVFSFTPAGGTTAWTGFDLSGVLATRVVADYQTDYQPSSPAKGWHYGWNLENNLVQSTSYQSMNWWEGNLPSTPPRYTDNGLEYPATTGNLSWGAFTPTGGHPGKGPANGASDEHYAMVGYEIRWPGQYALQGSVTTANPSATGLSVVILGQLGSDTLLDRMSSMHGTGVLAFPGSFTTFNKGDILWVAIGPDGDDTADGFLLDMQIVYTP